MAEISEHSWDYEPEDNVHIEEMENKILMERIESLDRGGQQTSLPHVSLPLLFGIFGRSGLNKSRIRSLYGRYHFC